MSAVRDTSWTIIKMHQELSGVFLLLMVIALAALGFILRRLSRQGGSKPADDRNHRPVPNEHPAKTAVEKPQSVQEFDAVSVHRPTMLALTTERENASGPEVFIQRAFKVDREHWLEIESTPESRRRFKPLFANVGQLAWVPGSAFERHIFSVSFSPALEAGLQTGIFRTDRQRGVVTHVTAVDETGEVLGEPMKMSLEGSQFGLVGALWGALNPRGMAHELRGELEKENAELAKRLADLPQHVAYETVKSWTLRYASLSAVVASAKAGVAPSHTEEYFAEVDRIASEMHEQARVIDEAIAKRASSVFNLEDADDALVHAIAYMYVCDLTVRFLRICSLLRVSIGDTFEEEVRCANAIALDVNQFTDVKDLIATAHKAAHAKLDLGSMRNASAHEIARATTLTKHAEELVKVHDEFLDDLRAEARMVQEIIDQTVLRQVRMHRYAVRVDDDGEVEKFFVLNTSGITK